MIIMNIILLMFKNKQSNKTYNEKEMIKQRIVLKFEAVFESFTFKKSYILFI